MKRLPFGVRVAAGITATAFEHARQLPTKLLGLPVTAASETLQHAMRFQQGLTELAVKGDEALSGWRPVERAPSWATFDEDLLDASPFEHGSEHRPGDTYGSEPLDTGGTEEREIAKLRADLMRYDERDPSTLNAWDAVARQLSSTATEPRAEPEQSESRAVESPDTESRAVESRAPESTEAASPDTGSEPATQTGQAAGSPQPEPPLAFPNYPELSLPQLRARLRRFSAADLTELLDYELATRERQDYVRMLRNRIETVRSDESAQ